MQCCNERETISRGKRILERKIKKLVWDSSSKLEQRFLSWSACMPMVFESGENVLVVSIVTFSLNGSGIF